MSEVALTGKHIRQFPREVREVLISLTREGVRFRVIDPRHVLLYPRCGGRPFKVAAGRPAEQTLRYLETQFERRVTG